MPELKTIDSGKLLCVDIGGPEAPWEESFGRLKAYALERRIPVKGDPLTLVYGDPQAFNRDRAHWVAALELAGEAVGDGEIMVVTQPVMRVAAETLQGDYAGLPELYRRLFEWIREKDLMMSGAAREFYLQGPGPQGRGDAASYLTEVQIPVVPVSASTQADGA